MTKWNINRSSAGLAGALWFMGGSTVLLLACLGMTGGHLVYTLDDPYIHLAVAENTLRGGYGINFPEVSSPSSSILWPFLLSPTLAVGLGTLGPLILNLGFGVWSSWLICSIFQDHCAPAGGAANKLFFALFAAPVLVLATNASGLAFTGMEHCLHVLLTLLLLRELASMAEGRAPGPVLVGLVIVVPLVRFEGLALSLATVATLWIYGHRRTALQSLMGLAGCLAVWVIITQILNLPPLPSSVLVKSGVSADVIRGNGAGFMGQLPAALIHSAHQPMGRFLWATLIAIAVVLVLDIRGLRAKGIFLLPAAAAISGHLLVGQYGWWYRYEVYAVAVALVSLFVMYGWGFRNGRRGRSSLILAALIVLIALIPAGWFAKGTLLTPLASANIYQQQYQMHRFAADFFPEPVAVNDLGYVSFRNDAYVLDLWGLGSEKVRQLRQRGALTPLEMASLTDQYEVSYAMIYPEWFGNNLPATWCPMAELHTSKVTAASSRVVFFLTRPERELELTEALERFSTTLPKGAVMIRRDSPCPASQAS